MGEDGFTAKQLLIGRLGYQSLTVLSLKDFINFKYKNVGQNQNSKQQQKPLNNTLQSFTKGNNCLSMHTHAHNIGFDSLIQFDLKGVKCLQYDH